MMKKIEFETSPSLNPPGVQGMAPAKASRWFRVDGGEWVRVGSCEEDDRQAALEALRRCAALLGFVKRSRAIVDIAGS